NRGYEGGGRKLMGVAIPATKIDKMIDEGYVGTGKKLIEVAIPATKIDEAIDQGYVKTSKKLLETVGPATRLDETIDRGYIKGGEEFVEILGPRATKFDMAIDRFYIKRGEDFVEALTPSATEFDRILDQLYIKRGERFVKVVSLPEDLQRRVLGKEMRFKYLREPVAIFDQSADEFFREVGENVISLVKYPYAIITYPIDLLFGPEEYIKSLRERAEVFERESRKLLYETPNISGISAAVVIMVTMLAIYLISAL
ncbi:MAG: hypothetical protein ACE5PM_09375, partial [Candidatus Hydrothermarchaeales archaeon]